MPIYEYACQDCGHEFEFLVRNNETACCPSCGRTRLAKRFSVPAAHTGAGEPACAARDAGACEVSDCCGKSCNLRGLT